MTTTNNNLFGTDKRPRVSVLRSNRYISAQLIDDRNGKTILSFNSKKIGQDKKPVELAKLTGVKIAELAKAKKIEAVVFDRGNLRYHGQVKALAEGLRDGGLSL